MEAVSPGSAVSATMRASEVELSGVLVRTDSWSFSPMVPLDRHERHVLSTAGEVSLTWGERDRCYEVAVTIGRIMAEDIAIQPVGEERRNQRRRAVRAPLQVPCRIVSARRHQVVTYRAQTTDMSATGASVLLFGRNTGPVDPPPLGTAVGVVFEFDERPLPVVAQVVGHRSTDAGRTVLRLRFDQICRTDSDEIHRLVLKSEREHPV